VGDYKSDQRVLTTPVAGNEKGRPPGRAAGLLNTGPTGYCGFFSFTGVAVVAGGMVTGGGGATIMPGYPPGTTPVHPQVWAGAQQLST
jgi:hypothetical protein